MVYSTLALSALCIDDDELRRVVFRAMNMLCVAMFKEGSDRRTPVALIPISKPNEAIYELEFTVNELGLKAIVVNAILGAWLWCCIHSRLFRRSAYHICYFRRDILIQGRQPFAGLTNFRRRYPSLSFG